MTKYEIIKQEIKEQIKDNILKPNQVIKSENEMCQCYKVSRVTVRKAIDELCAEGILYRIKGKGCFVRELADQKRSRIYSFTEAVRNEGKLPGKKQLSLEKKEAEEIMKAAVVVANVLKEKLGTKDINLLNNSGQLAGQTVMHFHLHVLPRYENDEIDFHQVDHEPNFLELDKLYSILKP